MASVTYSGTFGGKSGSQGLTAEAIRTAGTLIPSHATITNVSYSLKITAGGYSASKKWLLTQLAVGGENGSPITSNVSVAMSDDKYTFSGDMAHATSDVSKFSGETITVFAKASTTHDSTSFLWDFEICVSFEEFTACGAPTALSCNPTLTTGKTTLTWSGAKAGNANAITGYEVQYRESSDNATWGSWTALTTIESTETSGSISPNASSTPGNYRQFRIRTLGAAESSYYSGWKTSTNSVRRDFTACGAPTAFSCNPTLTTGKTTLTWSSAKAGDGNAITGYEVQYRESSNGSTWGEWTALTTVASTETSGSISPNASSTPGNYRQFRIRTLGAAGSSYYSAWKTSTNTVRRDHAPLAGFTDATLTKGTTPIKAIHMQELQERVATLRAFYGLSAYNFSKIVAGQTSLAGWKAHVLEIRAAIDGIDKPHETWLTFTENKPRADIVQQLRDVVLSL